MMKVKGVFMKKPNLFNYATSELSQDAFICWLLDWGNPEYRSIDENLHKCALCFISMIFQKCNKKISEKIDLVKVEKQFCNIDVLCIINKTYAIIIEDKIGTENHSDQLNRYYKSVKDKLEFSDENILRIYLKTGDQSNYNDVRNNNYEVFLRKNFLEVLSYYNGNNSILLDYRKYLQKIEDEVNSYLTISVKHWNDQQWIGFFIKLREEIKKEFKEGSYTGNWGYINNPSNSFYGFWITDSHCCKLYVQLEKEKLCVKIRVDDPNKSIQSKTRNFWYDKIIKKSVDDNISLIRPQKFGTGHAMTVCMYKEDYRICNENNLINIDKTVKVICRISEFIASIKNESSFDL